MFRTVIFFLPESGKPDPIPHREYVRLVRGEAPTLKYSGQQVRVADWYIKLEGGRPIELENESYSFLKFDESGHVVWPSEDARRNACDRVATAPDTRDFMTLGSARGAKHLHGNAEHLAWLPTPGETATLREMVFQGQNHY